MNPLFIMPHIQVFGYLTFVPLLGALLFGLWWLIQYIPYKRADQDYQGFQVGEESYRSEYHDIAEYKKAHDSWMLKYKESARLRAIRNEKDDGGVQGSVAGILLIPAVIFGVILTLMLIPFNSKYWTFYELEGKVASISNVFEADESELVSNAVVTLDGFDTPFVVNDPRILLYEGETLKFRCDWEFVPGGEDKLGCLIAEYPKTK